MTDKSRFLKGGKMKVFKKAEWIWLSSGEGPDQYVDFCDSFNLDKIKSVFISVSVDSDYTLFVNGEYAASGQYGDFEHYKIYDKIDITGFLKEGENKLYILAYHCGVSTQRYRQASAGLIYEVSSQNEILASSSAETLSRENPNYKSGKQLFVTKQLGFTFEYDANGKKNLPYEKSVVVNKNCSLYERPIKKAQIKMRKPYKQITEYEGNHYLIDLGGETVGLATLDIFSETNQEITVAWGEHIKDGGVRKTIDGRNFFFTYHAKKGENRFTDYMLRLGCRYLEVFSQNPIKVNYVGILPQVYETDEADVEIENELDRKIYDTCVNTLNLCMMEHYVDCPWREQALYTFDSRNQMLCGYYAFKDKNREYARANLKLIGKDTREDRLLSICYPCGVELAIPSFSLYYLVSVKEYTYYTGDTSLALEVYDKLIDICEEFKDNMKDGLAQKFTGENMWNFYDWSPLLENVDPQETAEPDLVVNCLFIMALDALKDLCSMIGKDFLYEELVKTLREETKKAFAKNGLFTLRPLTDEFSSLANALAVLTNVASKAEADRICEKLVKKEFIESSLSMKIFEYEALLYTDSTKYSEFVLDEIRKNYKVMLESGSDTVWETKLGESDFDNAGSLCHGWSAVPVYIYHKLGIAKQK